MEADTDTSLVSRMERARGDLLAFLTALSGDREAAKDLFQETCFEVWRSSRRFRPESDFGSWVRGIARKVVLRERRRNARLAARALTPEVMVEVELGWSRRKADDPAPRLVALLACLDRLEESPRRLLTWRYRDRLSTAEIADRANRSEPALKMLFVRLRKKLFDCVTDRMRGARDE